MLSWLGVYVNLTYGILMTNYWLLHDYIQSSPHCTQDMQKYAFQGL